jgi:alpha-1,3-rhamnosyltransferase
MPTSASVTVVVPAYNHERYIDQTLDSLVAQTHTHLSVTVVDDGSRDGTATKVESRHSELSKRFEKFKFVRQSNVGITRTLNAQIPAVDSELVLILASDDRLVPNSVAKLVEAATEHPKAAVFAANASFIDENGQFIGVDDLGNPAPLQTAKYSTALDFHLRKRNVTAVVADFGSHASLLQGNYLPIGSLVRKRAFVDAGLFDPNTRLEDWDMWLKLSRTETFHYTPEPLAQYRWHGSNSVKTKTALLLQDGLSLLARERPHCQTAKQDRKNWNEAFASLLLTYLHARHPLGPIVPLLRTQLTFSVLNRMALQGSHQVLQRLVRELGQPT